MALSGFPNKIQVVLGQHWESGYSFWSCNTLNEDDVVILTQVPGTTVWSEDGTLIIKQNTNRLKINFESTRLIYSVIHNVVNVIFGHDFFGSYETGKYPGLFLGWLEHAFRVDRTASPYVFKSLFDIDASWYSNTYKWPNYFNYTDLFKSMEAVGGFENEDICLRYATEPNEGEGWCVLSGDSWVQPEFDWGAFEIRDANGVTRMIIFDRNDDEIYELDTYDRVNTIKNPVLDKEDVDDTEITWSKWLKEDVYGE